MSISIIKIKQNSPRYDNLIAQMVILGYFECPITQIQSALLSGRLKYVRATAAYLLFIHTKLSIRQIALSFKTPYNAVNAMILNKAIDVRNGRRAETTDIKNILNILKQNQCQI